MTGEDRLRLLRARGAEVVLVRELGGRRGEEEGLRETRRPRRLVRNYLAVSAPEGIAAL